MNRGLRRAPVGGGADVEVLRLEIFDQQLAHVGFVVDDQDAERVDGVEADSMTRQYPQTERTQCREIGKSPYLNEKA